MNINLGHLSNYIQSPRLSTTVRSILDNARTAGKQAPPSVPQRTLAVRLPSETVEWLRQQAEEKGCAMAQVARAFIADQVVSELTELYQQKTTSPADFSAALWTVLGYEPGSSPGEEVYEST
jgi:aryl-alcohol dehydrogenase-like predicted oxidoreductase